jgi:hypothetical protein
MTSRRQNKFADLISTVRSGDDVTTDSVPSPSPPTLGASESPPVASDDSPRRGRPSTGKRSNPAFEQVTSYIRRDTNIQGNTRDFSDLVEELLQAWLTNRR